MAWLIACPYHYLGIFGLVFFFVVFFFQLDIIGYSESGSAKKLKTAGLACFFNRGSDKYLIQWERIQTEVNLQ
jgi:hypothetical protein